ncbi:MAG: HAD family hydrolase [Myxococcales bacterium]|nr:HAD family hydrolase [Myxococcales bacterium]
MSFATLTTLLLDAGNTVVFLDVHAVAAVARAEGVLVDPASLSAVEGAAKRRYEALLDAGGSHETGWGLYLETLLVEGGVDADVAPTLIAPLRAAHDELNLWRRVPDDLWAALAAARAMGLRLGVVSNSEGRLPELFAHVGLGDAFEVIVDSAHEGVRKPDPEIFRRATERMGIAPSDALYAGDIPSVDVDGALGAGLEAALIDPLGFYPDHARSPRYASVAELVEAIRLAR